ncbi:MAG: tetratricopeptide repeat protein [Pyrinomonadaceae bacterium]
MTKKKKKATPSGKIQSAELVKKAEESLKLKRYDEAIQWLTRAEVELQRQPSKNGGQVKSPAGADELLVWVNTLLADAFFSRALTLSDVNQRIFDLEESVKRDASEGRYFLALGIGQLTIGESEKAVGHLQQARELLPHNRLAERAWALGLLASGSTHEVKDWFRQQPQEKLDADLKRLQAVRELLVDDPDRAAALLGCATSPSQVAVVGASDESSVRSGAVHAVQQVKTQASIYDQLVCGLLPLTAGDQALATEQLAALSLRRENNSRAEQAAVVTGLFYRATAHFQTQRFAEAVIDFTEALNLARTHGLNLPWPEQFVAYCHRIAEELFATDINKSIECWKLVLEIGSRDQTARANLDVARRLAANRAWHDGLYERASELWQESLKHHPQDEALLKNAALACEKGKHKDQAVAHWRRLIRLWRSQLKSRRTDEQFGKQLLQAEKHLIDLMLETRIPVEEVQKEIDASLKINPDNGELRRLSVEIYLGRGRPQQAFKQIEALERIQGESVELLLLKGVTLSMLERVAAAKQAIERAYTLEPGNAAARAAYLLVLGQASSEAHGNNQLELAADLCQQQLKVDPRYRSALAHLGCLYFHLEEPDKAQEAIARIIELDPTKAENYVEAGTLYLDHGKTRAAEAEFKKALALNPDAESYRRIGESYLNARKPKKALQNFDRAAETGSVETLIEIAETLHDADKDREAEKYVDLAMIKDSEHPLPHFIKSLLLVEREEVEEALDELTTVERLAAGQGEYREMVEEARLIPQEDSRDV